MSQEKLNRGLWPVNCILPLLVMVLSGLLPALSVSGAPAGHPASDEMLFQLLAAPANLQGGANSPQQPVVSDARRGAPVGLNPVVQAADAVAPGAVFKMPLLDGDVYTARIDRVSENVMGSRTLRARIDGFPMGHVILSTTHGNTLGTIHIPEKGIRYQLLDPSGEGAYHLIEPENRELDLGCCSNHGAKIPPPLSAEEAQRSKTTVLSDPSEPVVIDVMIVYTPAARTWALGQGGIDNVINQAMETANLALENSDVFITKNLIHSAEVDYEESGDSGDDLDRLTETDDGFMDEVHDLREVYGADLVALFAEVEDTGGLAWVLSSVDGRPEFGFSLTRVQQAADGFTHAHEMGHNMGLGHHKEQTVQPGPGLFDYSAGWRWVGDSGDRHVSVMSYESGSNFPDGETHRRVAHFSNPDITFDGVATGDPDDGDAARSMRETKHAVAGYRMSLPPPGAELSVDPTSRDHAANPVSNQTVSVSSNIAWEAAESDAWITLDSSSGANNGNVRYSLKSNPSLSPRTGTITFSGSRLEAVFTVEQSGAAVDLGDAMGLNIGDAVTGGDANWFVASDIPQSGAIGHSQESWVEAEFVGPGTLTFDWKVSSELNFDFLEVYVDGERLDQISGEVDWQENTVVLAAGAQTVRWTYVKDASASAGADAGWVRNLEFSENALELELDPSSREHDSTPVDNQSIEVSANVAWDVTASDSWISLDTTEGFNNGTVGYALGGNPASAPRTGTITFSGGDLEAIFTVDQLGAPVDLSEALGQNVGDITTSPTASWFVDAEGPRSGVISHDQESWVETEFVGPGKLSFEWKVSSELNFDFLELYVNGELLDQISGEADWQENSIALSAGVQTVRWNYIKDRSVTRGDDAGWVRNVDFTGEDPRLSLDPASREHDSIPVTDQSIAVNANVGWKVTASEAWITLDTTEGNNNGSVSYSLAGNAATEARTGTITLSGGGLEAVFTVEQSGAAAGLSEALGLEAGDATTGGDAAWVVVSGAPTSGAVSDSQESWVEAEFVGPGVLAFDWKVSSERSFDLLEVYVNGERQDGISGEVDWQEAAVALATGTQTVRWSYTKDRNRSAGDDTGSVRNVEFTAGAPELTLDRASSAYDSAPAENQNVSVSSNVPWTADRGDATWITLDTSSGVDDGTISYAVSANAGTETRVGTITVRGGGLTQVFTVEQAGNESTGPTDTWYDGAEDLGGNWRWLPWLRSFNISQEPWIFHPQHGWLYPFGDDPAAGMFFWDARQASFLYTTSGFYPTMYRFSDGKWIRYQIGSSNPRWFVDLQTGVWEGLE